MSKDIFNQTRLLRAQSNPTLSVSRDRASATSGHGLFIISGSPDLSSLQTTEETYA